MIKTIYICDRCGREVTEADIFELIPACPGGKLTVPAEVSKLLGERHVCADCIRNMFKRRTIRNEDGFHEVAKNEHVETPSERDMRKTRYVSKKNYDAICKLYKEGKELEEISDALMIAVCEVSKVVNNEGLGAERYKGQNVPSEGSAPIRTGAVKYGEVR